eukprot:1155897-Ditylum_brightwellii.AAC.1
MAEGLDTADVHLKFQELINAKHLKISHITSLAKHLKTEVLYQAALLKEWQKNKLMGREETWVMARIGSIIKEMEKAKKNTEKKTR